MKTLGKNEVILIKEIDSKVKNKFRFEWLDTSVKLKSKKFPDCEVKLGDSIGKLDIPGKALCSYCNDVISYGGKGKVALVDHLQSAKHVTHVEHKKRNYTLGCQFSKKPQDTPLFPSFSNNRSRSRSMSSSSEKQSAINPSNDGVELDSHRLVPLSDRTSNLEAMILSMMAENNISFSVAPKLVELIKECSLDPKALANFSLDRCTAAYKLKCGLSDSICMPARHLDCAYENEEHLKAQVLQEQQLRSVTESCLMEERASWEQARTLLHDTKGRMRLMGEQISRLRHHQKDLKKQMELLLRRQETENVTTSSKTKNSQLEENTNFRGTEKSETVVSGCQVINDNSAVQGETNKETKEKEGDSHSIISGTAGGPEVMKKSEKCLKEMQQTLSSLVLSADHILNSTHNISNLEKDINSNR